MGARPLRSTLTLVVSTILTEIRGLRTLALQQRRNLGTHYTVRAGRIPTRRLALDRSIMMHAAGRAVAPPVTMNVSYVMHVSCYKVAAPRPLPIEIDRALAARPLQIHVQSIDWGTQGIERGVLVIQDPRSQSTQWIPDLKSSTCTRSSTY